MMASDATILCADFYITGGTVPRDAACYVARQADTDLLEGLRHAQFCYVLTARQMGKSSLMVRTATRLRQEGVACVILDLTAIGQNLDAERWYGGLLNQLGQQMKLEDELDDAWLAPSSLGPMQRWMQCLCEVVLKKWAGNIVIFVDEIDAVRSLPFSADEFFAGIRECYNRRTADSDFQRLSFCLLGVATPADLIRDARTTPFNIGKRIELTDFTEAEASPLAAGFTYVLDGERIYLQTTESHALLKRVLYWTGGHPYLTQRLCSALSEHAATMRPSDAQVDRLCTEWFLDAGARERDDNLLFVRERLLRSDVDIAGLLLLYRDVWEGKRVAVDETNPLISLLRLSGIARVRHGLLKPRNRIYSHVFDRRWAAANMPDAEVQRQKAARRRGFMAAAVPSMIALSIVSAALLFAYGQWRLAIKREQNERSANGVAQSKTIEAIKAKQRSDQLAADNGALAKDKGKLAEDLKVKIREIDDKNTKLVSAVAAQKSALALSKAEKRKADQLAIKERNARKRADAQTEHADYLAYDASMNLIQSLTKNGPDPVRIREILNQSPVRQRRFEWYYWDKMFRSIDWIDLKGHTKSVMAVAVSQDASTIVTGSLDGTARVWDARTAQTVRILRGHSNAITAAVVSQDARTVITGSLDGTARIWDARTGSCNHVLKEHIGPVMSVALSQDGGTVVTGSDDGTARVWKERTGQTTSVLAGSGRSITGIAVSRDGRTVVTRSDDGTAQIWRLLEQKFELWLGLPGWSITTVAVSQDGGKVVTAMDNGDMLIWDVPKRFSNMSLRGHTKRVASISVSPDGNTIATGSWDGTVRLWNATTGQPTLTLNGHSGPASSVALFPDGQAVVVGGDDGNARIWHIKALRNTLAQEANIGAATAVAFSPDVTMAAMGHWDGSAQIWDAKLKQTTRISNGDGKNTSAPSRDIRTINLVAGAVYIVALSQDGRTLATAGWENIAHLWDVRTRRTAATLKGHTKRVTSVALSGDGSIAVTGSLDCTARVWDTKTGQTVRILNGYNDPVTAVTISQDGRTFATGGANHTARIWYAGGMRDPKVFIGHSGAVTAIALARDGRAVVTGSEDGTARVWDVATGQPLSVLKGHIGPVTAVALSTDGRTVVTGGVDRTVRIWDVHTGQTTLILPGRHAQDIAAVVLSPNNRLVAAASGDLPVTVWDTISEPINAHETAGKWEAENLRILNLVDCRAFPQDMEHFGSSWGEGKQLFMYTEQQGSEVTLELPCAKTGKYNIAVYFTGAPDYGIVQTLINDFPIGVPMDNYAPQVERKPRLTLGRVELKAGNHRLTFRITGKNSASTGYFAGVDCIELTPLSSRR